MCVHLETVAADGLVTGASVKAVMQGGSRRHQQAVHLGAVTLEHGHTLMALK